MNDQIKVIQDRLPSFNQSQKDDLLVQAINLGKTKVAKLALDSGADVNVKIKHEHAIVRVLESFQFDLFKMFIEKGAKIKFIEIGFDLLKLAIEVGHVPSIKLLVEHKDIPNLNSEFLDRGTPLEYAVSRNHLPVVKYLVEQKLENPEKALFLAIKEKKIEAVTLLISSRIDHKERIDINRRIEISKLDENRRIGLAIKKISSPSTLIPYTLKLCPLEFAIAKSAIENDDRFEIVKLLLINGAKILSEDGTEEIHPALFASKCNNLPVLRYLLQNGANVNDFLHEAIKSSNGLEVIELLIKFNANVHLKDKEGNTPLKLTITHGKLSIAAELIKAGAQLDPKDFQLPTMIKKHLVSPDPFQIVNAARDGNQFLTLLIDHKADVNQVDEGGDTALNLAASLGNLTIATALIKAGAKLEAVDSKGQTALYQAAMKGHDKIINLILEHKTTEDLIGPFWAAVCGDPNSIQSKCMTALLKHEPKLIHAKHPKDGTTLLMVAVRSGVAKNVNTLIEDYKVNLEEKNPTTGETALLYGIRHGQAYIVKNCLLAKGANMYAVNAKGQNALELAVSFGHVDIVRVLLNKGFKIDRTDAVKKLFALKPSIEVRRFLIEYQLEAMIAADEKSKDMNPKIKIVSDDEDFVVSIDSYRAPKHGLKIMKSLFKSTTEKEDAVQLLRMLKEEKNIDKLIKFQTTIKMFSPLVWLCDVGIQQLKDEREASSKKASSSRGPAEVTFY